MSSQTAWGICSLLFPLGKLEESTIDLSERALNPRKGSSELTSDSAWHEALFLGQLYQLFYKRLSLVGFK